MAVKQHVIGAPPFIPPFGGHRQISLVSKHVTKDPTFIGYIEPDLTQSQTLPNPGQNKGRDDGRDFASRGSQRDRNQKSRPISDSDSTCKVINGIGGVVQNPRSPCDYDGGCYSASSTYCWKLETDCKSIKGTRCETGPVHTHELIVQQIALYFIQVVE